MTDTVYIVSVAKFVDGKYNGTEEKFDTEKKARGAYEKARLDCVQDKFWNNVCVDSACFFLASHATCDDPMEEYRNAVSIRIDTLVNLEYYVRKIDKELKKNGIWRDILNKAEPEYLKYIRSTLKIVFDRGYEKGLDAYSGNNLTGSN